VHCPSGKSALSTGYTMSPLQSLQAYGMESRAATVDIASARVRVRNANVLEPITITPQAICAPFVAAEFPMVGPRSKVAHCSPQAT
jgi:hypothetical protein